MKKLISLLLCLAMVLSLACFASAEAVEATDEPTEAAEILWDENHETILLEMGAEYGEGAKTFTLVTNHLNQVTICTVHTDEQTVGAALAALNIIAGVDSDFGLYVKTVDGYLADYDTDGSYWAFYIDGEYAATSVDATEISEDSTYLFQVIDGEGNETAVTVSTDADTVGAALAELGIVAGEDSDFGLYVKTVNNVTADYDTDGSYWAFYIDGEYASTGVDATEINEDAVYTFQVEKA